MLRSVNELRGHTIAATDGEIGTVHDVYFDDEAWGVRYFVVDTGKWLPGRRVLLSPLSVHEPHWADRRLPVSLTRQRVKDSPSIDTAQPVSRAMEAELFQYYGYPLYWPGGSLWGPGAYPIDTPIAPVVVPPPATQQTSRAAENHLRSAREVIGYHLHATDGDLGHVADFLVDDEGWRVRQLVVETGHWWSGRTLLVSPDAITAVDWLARQVSVGRTRDEVTHAPGADPART